MTRRDETKRLPLPFALACCCAILALCVCAGAWTRAAGAVPFGGPDAPAVAALEDGTVFTIPEGAAYVPGEVLVTVGEGMDAAQLAAQLTDGGVSTVDPDSVYWLTDDTARLSVTQGFTVEDAVNELLLSGAVEAAQPDYVYFAEDEPALELAEPADEELELLESVRDEALALELVETNDQAEPADALLAAQNDAVSDDPYSIFQWSLASINAPQAWRLAETSPLSKVGVAVIDAGFDVDHEDIRNVIAPGSPYNAYRASEGIKNVSGNYLAS